MKGLMINDPINLFGVHDSKFRPSLCLLEFGTHGLHTPIYKTSIVPSSKMV